MAVVALVTNRKSSDLATLVSCAFALEYNLKVLVMHRDPLGRTERALLGPDARGAEYGQETDGILELFRLHRSRKLSPESVRDSSRRAVRGTLDVLPCRAAAQMDGNVLCDVAKVASKAYDIVLLDLQNTPGQEAAKIAGTADFCVAAISQDRFQIEDYRSEELPALEKSIVVIEDYDANSKYSAGRIAKMAGLSRTPLVLPYSPAFKDAVSDMDAVNFMRRMRNTWRGHPDSPFAKSCAKLAQELLKAFGYRPEDVRKI